MSGAGRRILGIGLASGAGEAELAALCEAALAEADLSPGDLAAIATLDRRADHPALRALAERWGLPVEGIAPPRLAAEADRLEAPSGTVAALAGLPGVAEAAALCAAGPGARLRLAKRTGALCTAALAEGAA